MSNIIQQYLDDNGYATIEDWARDSDYHQDANGDWRDDNGNPVDIEGCLEGAIEVSSKKPLEVARGTEPPLPGPAATPEQREAARKNLEELGVAPDGEPLAVIPLALDDDVRIHADNTQGNTLCGLALRACSDDRVTDNDEEVNCWECRSMI